jgi:hypothetical protein
MDGVHTCLPGQIESYSPLKAQASVKPLVKEVRKNGEIITLPVIVNVPVVFPKTKRGGFVFPVERGDGVMIMFSDRSLDEWLARGDDVPYTDPRQHNLTDAIAIPGLYSFAANINDGVPVNSTQISAGSGRLSIDDLGKFAIESGNNELLEILSNLMDSLISEPNLTNQVEYTQYKTQIDSMRQ